MYGADPKFLALGTKTGCRRIFAEEGVKHPLGYEGLANIDDAINAITEMQAITVLLSSTGSVIVFCVAMGEAYPKPDRAPRRSWDGLPPLQRLRFCFYSANAW